ncbi:MAG: M42 family peptidase, partial [Thermoproteus sp. AZ2]
GLISSLVGGFVDEFGNVVAGKGPIAFIAHMDEIGLLATHIEEDGRVAAQPIGALEREAVHGARVLAYGDGWEAVGVAEARGEEILVDFGDGGAAAPSPPLPISFYKEPRAEGRRIFSPSLDDRAGCWALAEASRRIDAKFIWSTQEELESLGAAAALKGVKLAVVVDAMPCCRGGVRLGGGAVLVGADDFGVYGLFRRAAELARRKGVPAQIAASDGGSDAYAAQLFGVPALYIGIPVKHLHSPAEAADLADIASAVELMELIAEDWQYLIKA